MPLKLLRPAALAFLAVTLLWGLGCLSMPDFRTDDDDPGGGDGKVEDGGGGGTAVDRAYFLLQGSDLRSPDWPDAWADYDLFVCNPSLPAADVALIREDVPGATVLAYTNVADIRWDPEADNPYYQALTAVFEESYLLHDTATGEIVRIQGYDGTPGSGLPMWVVRPPSADVLADFHRDVTMQAGWDGLYVDQCTPTVPPWRQDAILAQTTQFDYDGDGVSDRMVDLVAAFEAGRPYFTARLRDLLGDEVVLVGNAGGGVADGSLNGITLEGAGERFTEAEARAILLDARAVAHAPWKAAVWVVEEGNVEVSLRLAEEISGVHYGEVSYFP
jgi:hypothetical protein